MTRTACFHDWYQDETGQMHYPCRRLALPDRRLCHKHAGMKAQLDRRRARNKVARATRKAQR